MKGAGWCPSLTRGSLGGAHGTGGSSVLLAVDCFPGAQNVTAFAISHG